MLCDVSDFPEIGIEVHVVMGMKQKFAGRRRSAFLEKSRNILSSRSSLEGVRMLPAGGVRRMERVFFRKEEAAEQIFLSPLRVASFSDTLTAKTGVAHAAYHFAPQGV